MLWLSRPPWAQWIGAGLVVVVALGVELAPEPSVAHPFAAVDIAPGSIIDATNTETRSVPSGLFEPIELAVPASRAIAAGEPVLVSDIDSAEVSLPKGWWVVSAGLPRGARVGDHVQVVMVETGRAVPGIVVTEGSTDPFDTTAGAIALAPDHAAEVATAAAEGRIAVLISTG